MICSNCKTANPESAKFCMNCGASLTSPNAGEQAVGNLNLERFTPRELLKKLSSAHGLAGERRIITILFCDVKGSTAVAEQLDPEEWTGIMNNAFERMIQPIYKYEGFIARLMGDAILAFFGAPIAHEDDPQRALLAALDVQSGIEPYSEQVKGKYKMDFKVRIGINTGLVVVGEVGSDLRMEYTAVGDAINLAARLEQTAEPGTIQISAETHKLVAPFFELESLGESQIKGKVLPVRTFRVLAVKGMPGRLRGLAGLSSPLIGRESELDGLEARIAALKKGRGAFVVVTGEAGLGKTSLIAEVHRRAGNDHSLNWLDGHALSYTQSVSYFAWRQIIRQSIGAREDDLPLDVRRRLNEVCSRCGLSKSDGSFIEALLAVESDESLKEVLDYQGEALARRVTQAMRSYLCGLANELPLVIVLDDLHWMDAASLNLLSSMIDLIDQSPILYLGLARPDPETSSWEFMNEAHKRLAGNFQQIVLQPLSSDTTSTLLANLLGMNGLPNEINIAIMEKAEGNPFFVEEIIRSLIETGQIVRVNTHWKIAGEINKILTPGTLSGVLGARIDRLQDETKHVLQIASVIGRSFNRSVLSSMVDSDLEIESRLFQLQQAGLIRESETGYVFRHALVQDAAYDSMLLSTRLGLHQRAGNILEKLYQDRLEEYAPLLANHFYASEDPRSLKYDLLSGDAAARLYANTEAVIHYGRALETAERIHADPGQIAGLYSKTGGALELMGRYEQALTTYDEMLAFAREQGDRSIELNALMAKATIYSIFSKLHNSALSEQILVQALEISNELGDRALQTRLNWNLMLNYLFSKRFDGALRYGESALKFARELDDREQLAFVLNDLCRLYTNLGKFDNAYEVVHEARDLWRVLDNQIMFIDSLGAEAEACFNGGDYDRSLELSSQALSLGKKIDNPWSQAYNCMLMGFVLADRGEIGRTIELWNQSIRMGEAANLLACEIGTRSDLAWIYGVYGAVDKGFQLVEEALAAANEKQPEWKSLPLAIRRRLHLLNGDLRSAEEMDGALEPVSIPYARYTILVCMANIELAMARGDYGGALTLVDDLLEKVAPVVRPDVPGVMRTKGDILLALNRFAEAQQILVSARAAAEKLGARHELWQIFFSLARVETKLGRKGEAQSMLKQAHRLVEEIAESLREVALCESFLEKMEFRERNGMV